MHQHKTSSYYLQNKSNNFLRVVLFLLTTVALTYLSSKHTYDSIATIAIEKISVLENKKNAKNLAEKHKHTSEKIATPKKVKNNKNNTTITVRSILWNKAVFARGAWVAMLLFLFCYYLRNTAYKIFETPQKLAFLFLNISITVGVFTAVAFFFPQFLYAVPFPLLPIVIRAFWAARLALFTQIITLLMLLFTIPDYLEFLTLEFSVGSVAILSVRNIYRRNVIIKTIVKIILCYAVVYTVFYFATHQNLTGLNVRYFSLFFFSGVLTFFVSFLIWVYENFFGLVSQIRLLELSNTNASLLKELNEKAPGTFQHSMQVASLAEKVARALGADAMMTKIAALYHDIGKIENPSYFTENQHTNINLHDELSPIYSAKIIIKHVIKGIEKAREHRIPEQIIDFIRTHHGNSLVYFFYKKQYDIQPMDEKFFRYNGPLPFSKETVILMMCDATEAACRSIINPTKEKIEATVEKVIEGQIRDHQYSNAPITFEEISIAKKVLVEKLKSMNHIRVAYPKE